MAAVGWKAKVMTSPRLLAILSIGSALFALGAALAWLRAATAKVSRAEADQASKQASTDGWVSASITINEDDLAGTLAVQGRWNRIAAACASAAAASQAAYAWLSAPTW